VNTLKLVLILIIIFIIFSKSSILEQPIKKANVKTPTSVLTSIPEKKVDPTRTPTKIPVSESKVIENTATLTNEIKQVQGINDTWVYPGAQQVGVSGETIILQSNDDITQITNWYKDKIRSTGMNAISFVATNTNGNVLNKLSGAKAGQEVTVEITKLSNDQKIKINVTIKSS
jgi:hypothetical protein